MARALGFVVRPEHPPEELPALAARVEAAGFDELWLWEDCFFAGGIAATGAALAATLSAVRALLAGEEVHADGRYVRLDGVRLDHPPADVPPVYAGVRRA